MNLKSYVKKIASKFFTFVCFHGIDHGIGCKCNFYCKFTKKTIIGKNCHFNGIQITGNGNIIVGNNFHSGKGIVIMTSYHNFDNGKTLPYDDTYNDKDVIIEDNVWLGDSVIILGSVKIGEGAVIQAGSVVCQDIPPLAIAGGHPASPFKYRNKDHYYMLKEQSLFM